MDDTSGHAVLRAEYLRLKRLYSEAVDHLFAVGYQVTDAEHRRLRNAVEEARVQSEVARLKLHDTKVHTNFS
jgi:hypothetical protein